MAAQELGILLDRATARPALLLSWRSCRKPLADPFPERHLIGLDMRAGVAGSNQFAQLLAGFWQRATEGLRVPLAVNAIPQPPFSPRWSMPPSP